MIALAPEEIELNRKRALLDRLKDRLANGEEAMADLRAELEQFEAQYTMEVGRYYADLDEIEARIAEEEVKLNPEDEEIKEKGRRSQKACRGIGRPGGRGKLGRLLVQMAAHSRSEKGLSQTGTTDPPRPRPRRGRANAAARPDGEIERRLFGRRSESAKQTRRGISRQPRSRERRFDRRRSRPCHSPDRPSQEST